MRPLASALVIKEDTSAYTSHGLPFPKSPWALRVKPPISHKYLCRCHIPSSSCLPPALFPLHGLYRTHVSFHLSVCTVDSLGWFPYLSLSSESLVFTFLISSKQAPSQSFVLGKGSSAPHLCLDWISEVFRLKLFSILLPFVLFPIINIMAKVLIPLLHVQSNTFSGFNTSTVFDQFRISIPH